MTECQEESIPSSVNKDIVLPPNSHALQGDNAEAGPALRQHLGDVAGKELCVNEDVEAEEAGRNENLELEGKVDESEDTQEQHHLANEQTKDVTEHFLMHGTKDEGGGDNNKLWSRREHGQLTDENMHNGENVSTSSTINHATNHLSADDVVENSQEEATLQQCKESSDTNVDISQNAFPDSGSPHNLLNQTDSVSKPPATCTDRSAKTEQLTQESEMQEDIECTPNGPHHDLSEISPQTESVTSTIHSPLTTSSIGHLSSSCAITDSNLSEDIPSLSNAKNDHSQTAHASSKTNESDRIGGDLKAGMTDPAVSNVAETCVESRSKALSLDSTSEQRDLKLDVQAVKIKMESAAMIPAVTESRTSRPECAGSTRSEEFCQNQYDDLISELDAELEELLDPKALAAGDPANGLLRMGAVTDDIQEFKSLREQSKELQNKVETLTVELKRMQEQISDQNTQIADFEEERKASISKLKKGEVAQNQLQLKAKELQDEIEQQKVELGAAKERLTSHDGAAKNAITKLQQEMILRVDQVKSMYEETIKEKEAIVIKYAKSEKEVMDQKKLREALERKKKELNLTVESLNAQLKEAKKDRHKMKQVAGSKETEASSLQKEIEQLKEEVSSQGIKVKWAQNKLKTELDSHKDTKVRLAKTEQRLVEAKEETEQIRKNCQEMIKTYQTSEEVKSNSLDKQLKVKHSELEQKLQEQKDHLEVHQERLRELESLKKRLADNMAELDSFKVKAKCLEDERLHSEELLAKFKELLNSQKDENRRLNKQLEEKKVISQQLEHLKETEIQLRSEVSGQKVDQSDLELELESSREKATELLQFTQKITAKNTSLSSENSVLQSKASSLESEVHKLQKELGVLQTSYSQLSAELKQEHQFREREASILTTKLSEKSRAVEQLSIQLDEARDDNKTLKRKHVANTKDLTRQLQQAHKRLESLESTDNAPRDNLSVGSRTSSSGSLDTLPGSTPSAVNSSGSSVSITTSGSSKIEEHSAPQDHTVAIATGNDYPGVDKGMLVDRIVRLQKAHQRKNDKMEFMQEHITHLIDELKKKSKIIQQYFMRDEAGALAPVSSDINKAQMSKQGGIMSSLYRSQQTDPTMTLDLSLEINRKLQAVLEDTLIKNITLKDNIETLGVEIARLLKDQQKKPTHHPSHR
ncbi:coiled-coil domain-containing protein 186-like [Asterias amurensis]|uniref:coiled-coil domain-containing protein 186-like n=1 Tax=Asterias amurensis TaxID=7602 RepID=UPI003AB5305A